MIYPIIILVVSLGIGFYFTKFIAPNINSSEWYSKISDSLLNKIGLFGCLILFIAIWGQIYLSFNKILFLGLYTPSCALLAFSLVRGLDKGTAGSLALNVGFIIMTGVGFFY